MIASVAIGQKYELEAERLQRSLGSDVHVITKDSPQYTKVSEDALIDGLYHKSNFANYIHGGGSVFFMDADMFTLTENPFATFKVKKKTDFAFVPYEGKWHFPDAIRQNAFNHFGYQINSGFMYFRTLEIAQDICSRWSKTYLERSKMYGVVPNINKNEYDEYALMLALMDTKYTIELLPKKWNVWELTTEQEIRASDAIFFQSHNFLDIV